MLGKTRGAGGMARRPGTGNPGIEHLEADGFDPGENRNQCPPPVTPPGSDGSRHSTSGRDATSDQKGAVEHRARHGHGIRQLLRRPRRVPVWWGWRDRGGHVIDKTDDGRARGPLTPEFRGREWRRGRRLCGPRCARAGSLRAASHRLCAGAFPVTRARGRCRDLRSCLEEQEQRQQDQWSHVHKEESGIRNEPCLGNKNKHSRFHDLFLEKISFSNPEIPEPCPGCDGFF
jgi:hypothetical protein